MVGATGGKATAGLTAVGAATAAEGAGEEGAAAGAAGEGRGQSVVAAKELEHPCWCLVHVCGWEGGEFGPVVVPAQQQQPWSAEGLGLSWVSCCVQHMHSAALLLLLLLVESNCDRWEGSRQRSYAYVLLLPAAAAARCCCQVPAPRS